jgi:hypothetical protein
MGLLLVLTGDKDFITAAGSFLQVNNSGTLFREYKLDTSSAVFVVNNFVGSFVTTRLISIDPISCSVVGTDSQFARSRSLSGIAGNFDILSTNASFLSSRIFAPSNSSINITDNEVVFGINRNYNGASALFEIVAEDVEFVLSLAFDPYYNVTGVPIKERIVSAKFNRNWQVSPTSIDRTWTVSSPSRKMK